jgi:hypothetical protein
MGKIYEQLRDYLNWGIGITVCIAALLLSKDKLVQLYYNQPVTAAFSTALLVTTFVWFFMYVQASRRELDMLDSAFDSDRIERWKGVVLPTVVGLSLLFGCLIAFSTNILIYSALVPLQSVLDLFGQVTINRNLNILVREKQFRGAEGERKGQILFLYYVEKPHLLRVSLILVVFCGAFGLAVTSHFLRQPTYGYISYSAIIAAIVIGEIVIRRWRKERDKDFWSKKEISKNQ